MSFRIRVMTAADVESVVALQPLAFPPPFDPDLLWAAEHIERHVSLFPEGQIVAETEEGAIIASCSNTRISEERWQAHESWENTVGGPFLETFDPEGTTLYGLDISVHPEFRRLGIGKALYRARYDLVVRLEMARYGTACRLPDFAAYHAAHPEFDVDQFAAAVVAGYATDKTLSPLLRMGLQFRGVLHNYMDDAESGNAAALLEMPRANLG